MRVCRFEYLLIALESRNLPSLGKISLTSVCSCLFINLSRTISRRETLHFLSTVPIIYLRIAEDTSIAKYYVTWIIFAEKFLFVNVR